MSTLRKFQFRVVAEPGTQSLCQILGMAALYDPQIIGGVIEAKSQDQMCVQLKLKFSDTARAHLLLARLKNLVVVRMARLVPSAATTKDRTPVRRCE
jgi:hypothetical protein